MDLSKFKWTREPESWAVGKDGTVEIVTKPHTDLWQRTYYHFRNDNAPVFQMETEEKFSVLSSGQIFRKVITDSTSAGSSCTWMARTG